MPVAGASQPGLAHQRRDPFAAMSLASAPQIGVDARSAVGLARAGVHSPDAIQPAVSARQRSPTLTANIHPKPHPQTTRVIRRPAKPAAAS